MTAPAVRSVLLDGLTRLEKADRVRELYAAGFAFRGIADMLGISRSYASSLYHDPDGEGDRKRKRRHDGTCVDCGRPTNNSGSTPPKRCQDCSTRHIRETQTFWTRERIIAAIQEWNELHGSPPRVVDWLKKVEGSPGQYVRRPRSEWVGLRRWPTVHACQARFGSWSNALRAAGFEPRPPFMLTEEWKAHGFTAGYWTADMIISRIQDWHAEHGRLPTENEWRHNRVGESEWPGKGSVSYRFGTWNNAIAAAGFTPRPSHRSR